MARYGRYKSRAGAIVGAIVGTAITCALAVGAWVHWDAISGFFKDIALMFEIAQEKVEQEKQEQEKTQGSGFIFDDKNSFNEGIFLTSVRIEEDDYAAYDVVETAESAYTIEATIEPANATQTALEWTVEFVDAANTWANGKTVTDYVTVSPYGDNGAVVSCLQSFAAQIAVKVALAENTALRASCVCDYAKRITAVNEFAANVNENGNIRENVYWITNYTESVKASYSSWNYYLTGDGYKCNYNKSIGTVEVDPTEYNILFEVKFEQEFYDSCLAKENLVNKITNTADYRDIKYTSYVRNIFQDNVELTEEELRDFITVMAFYRNAKIGSIRVSLTYRGETVVKVVDLMAGVDWTVAATNVTLSDSNLTF